MALGLGGAVAGNGLGTGWGSGSRWISRDFSMKSAVYMDLYGSYMEVQVIQAIKTEDLPGFNHRTWRFMLLYGDFIELL